MSKYELEAVEGSVAITSISTAVKLAGIMIDIKKGTELCFKINKNDKITRNLTILRYLAELAPSSQLYGSTLYHEATVNQYLDIFWNELELPLYYIITDPSGSYNFDVILTVIEEILVSNTYLVSSNVTLADIYLYSILKYAKDHKVITDKLSKYQSINRWYKTIENNV